MVNRLLLPTLFLLFLAGFWLNLGHIIPFAMTISNATGINDIVWLGALFLITMSAPYILFLKIRKRS